MIDVYVAELPKNESSTSLSCKERQAEINGLSNERVRRERYYVWRLLEYAIKNSLGADASRLCFTKGANRRWSCDSVEFSLSHSGDALAVAVCNNQMIGVDIEKRYIRNIERLAGYMLTPSEQIELDLLEKSEQEEWLIRRWCEKEAIFKFFNESVFAPKRIETAEFFRNSMAVEIGREKYILAVSAACKDDIRVFKNVDFLEA